MGEKKFYVECRNSKGGKPYCALMVELGYRSAMVCYDRSLIAEILGISLPELYDMKVGDKRDVATFNKAK